MTTHSPSSNLVPSLRLRPLHALSAAACVGLLSLALGGCTEQHALGGAGDAASESLPTDTMADTSPDTPAVGCSEDGVTYSVGDVVPRPGVCPVSCVCLEGGVVGRCTGACPPDASADDGPDAANADGGSTPAELCVATQGTVTSGLCCTSSDDFPDNCAIGGCSCSPSNSHTVSQCACASGCFMPAYGCVGPTGVCTVGADQSCNDSSAVSALHGSCVTGGRCACYAGFSLAASGKCS